MWSMSGRPCNPGSDLRQLWQALLGKNTPFPQCGVPETQEVPQPTGERPDGERTNQRKDAAVERHR